MNLSPEAAKARENAAGTDRYIAATMRAGPRLSDDETTIIVPSNWYNEQASQFWRSKGFGYRAEYHTWERPVERPLNGKTYGPQVWLKATRRQFFTFWPDLVE